MGNSEPFRYAGISTSRLTGSHTRQSCFNAIAQGMGRLSGVPPPAPPERGPIAGADRIPLASFVLRMELAAITIPIAPAVKRPSRPHVHHSVLPQHGTTVLQDIPQTQQLGEPHTSIPVYILDTARLGHCVLKGSRNSPYRHKPPPFARAPGTGVETKLGILPSFTASASHELPISIDSSLRSPLPACRRAPGEWICFLYAAADCRNGINNQHNIYSSTYYCRQNLPNKT